MNDALYFQRWLVDPTGGDVPERNVQLILSDSRAPGTRPTQQMVEDAMLVHIDRFKQTRLTQRRLYFFLSGHGISTGFGDLEGCRILMADASVDAIGVQTAGSILQRTPLFEEIVLFADSCREIEDDGFARNQLTIERAVKGLVKQAKDLDVRIMWGFASRWSQVVHECELPACDGSGTRVPHGRFTYALLCGLRRAIGAGGQVTKLTLEPYVGELISRLSDNQEPEFGGSHRIVLATPPPPPPCRVVLLNVQADHRVEIRNDRGFHVTATRNPSAARLELMLPEGRYQAAVNGSSSAFTVLGEEVHVEL